MVELSLPEARLLAVVSQGFGARPSTPSVGHLRKLAAQLHAFQIDSVNVLVRAGELRQMQAWLELDHIEVGRRGDVAAALQAHLQT